MRVRGAGVLLVVALAGCGQGGETVASAPEPSTPAAGAPASPEELPAPGRRAETAGSSLTGTVVEGVEAGCLLLSTADGDHLLLGADPSVVTVGARVTVRGRADPSVVTTCQQGVPFLVASATAERSPG